MARIIAYKIIAKDKFSAVARKVTKSTINLRLSIVMLGKDIILSNEMFNGFGKTLKRVGRIMSIGTVALGAAGAKSVIVSGQMESLRMSLVGISGSAEVGQQVLEDLLDFAAKTPFEITGLGDATKQLIASKVATDDLIPTLGLLGDIASVTGGDVMGLSRIYTKIRALPKLQMRAVHQMGARGIPLAGDIAEYLSSQGMGEVSIGQVTEAIAAGKISNTLALHVIEQMNKLGGVAHKAMVIQSATVPGLWSNIADEMHQTWAIVGDIVGEFLNIKGWMQSTINMLGLIRDFLTFMHNKHPIITGIFLTFVMFFAILGPILAIFGGIIAKIFILKFMMYHLAQITGIAALNINFLSSAMAGLKWILGLVAFKAMVIIAIIMAIVLVIGLVIYNWDALWASIMSGIETLVRQFHFLKDAAVDAVQAGFSGKVLRLLGVISSENDSSAQIDVNLNDPGGAVGSVDTSSSGNIPIKVGMAMTHTRWDSGREPGLWSR